MRIVGSKSAELASSKKGRRRHKKHVPMSTPVVQRLYEICREVFAGGGPGFIPPPEDVLRIRSVLDSMNLGDVGLKKNHPQFKNENPGGTPRLTYFELFKCPEFEICIFCLPPSAVIPLHNHPNMTVFSKILFGSMHIKSYDWVTAHQETNEVTLTSNGTSLASENATGPPENAKLAKLKTNAVFTAPCETSILYPEDGGNMHCFTAKTACAVLDVLGPPYSDPEGRHCAYYHEYPYDKCQGIPSPLPGEGEVFAWLKERSKPDDCYIIKELYRGPKIVPT